MDDYLNLAVSALWLVITLSLVPLIAAFVVALVFGLFQAMTQIRDDSLTVIPRNIVVLLVVLITLPWMVVTVSNFAESLFKMMLQVGS